MIADHDLDLLKVLVLEGRRELAAKDADLARALDANTRLWEALRQLQRAQFGRKSEKLDPDQLSPSLSQIRLIATSMLPRVALEYGQV